MTPSLSDFSIIGHQILFCHYLDVTLLVEVLPLFGEVDQFLVQQPIEQFEVLQTSLDIAVIPSAGVVQHLHGLCFFFLQKKSSA